MTPEIVSDSTFRWILTVLTVAGAFWALYDIVKMRKARGKDGTDPQVRDERFVYWIGIAIGVFALGGMLRYHGVF
ncbi:MAG: hypothetical protein JNL83_10545 [Myxococcales bacterium]|nr:hypothetical protein [Myxococcales bacterium]